MKCFELRANFCCQTHTGCSWSLTRDEYMVPRQNGQWDPYLNAEYEIGENTWRAAGGLTEETKTHLSKLWAFATGARRPLTNRHVVGDFQSTPTVDTIVDQSFVDAMQALDPCLFEFVPHDKVWDPKRGCPPWDGPFYLTSVLQMRPSYDVELSKMVPVDNVVERFEGKLDFTSSKRVVRASAISGGLI